MKRDLRAKGSNIKRGKALYFSASKREGALLLYLKGVWFHRGFIVCVINHETTAPPTVIVNLI